MVKIYIKDNQNDPYLNNNEYDHKVSKTVFDGKNTWTVIEHVKKEPINKLTTFAKAIFFTIVTFGIAPFVSSKVQGYWESLVTGKKIKEIYLLSKHSWKEMFCFSTSNVMPDTNQAFFIESFKKNCKSCIFDQIFVACCTGTGADIAFHDHDGFFKNNEFKNFEKGKSLLILIATDNTASERLKMPGYLDSLSDTTHLKEFSKDYANPVFFVSYEDYMGVKMPKDLVNLVTKGNKN